MANMASATVAPMSTNTALTSTARASRSPATALIAAPRRCAIALACAAWGNHAPDSSTPGPWPPDFETPLPLAALKTHLGSELPRLFATVVELRRQHRIEKHHRLGGIEPVLGAAQRQHVDSDAPTQVRRCHPGQRRERVGKARAIHLYRYSVRVRDCAERRD